MIQVPSYATEFVTLEKTIEFVARWGDDTHAFRIEALRKEDGSYSTHVYVRRHLTIKDAMTIEKGQQVQEEAEHYVWVNFPDAPYAHGKSADEALNFQMSLLNDRLKQP